ncbi:PTS cellobiose transporter subunit IIB, partial [Streptococcus suis]
MVKALIFCAGGMSSSLISKKTQTLFEEQGHKVEMNSVGVPVGGKKINASEYYFYLIIPQKKLHF